MAHIVFYEKPGCINNTQQKKLLVEAGHKVEACNLLTTVWTIEELASFFKGMEVSAWFNKSAPAIKSGDVVPQECSSQRALALMIKDPLLIRRPLMVIEDVRYAGFDVEALRKQINMVPIDENQDLENCPRSHAKESCSGQ